jgi:hypothetical protein
MVLQLVLILVVLIPLLAIVLDSQVGRALASRLERRTLDGPGGEAGDRIALLEAEVERLSKDVERLTEESDFVQKLLSEPRDERRTELPPGDGPS